MDRYSLIKGGGLGHSPWSHLGTSVNSGGLQVYQNKMKEFEFNFFCFSKKDEYT